MQFVKCTFKEGGTGGYTYQNDGEPLAVGDVVKVLDKSGDGHKRVWVTEIDLEKPRFDCKPVLGKYPAKPEQTDLLD